MSELTILTERDKAALRPFVRAAEKLEEEGMLRHGEHLKPAVYFEAAEYLALIYAFEAKV